jgi:anti-sigma factor RsiW
MRAHTVNVFIWPHQDVDGRTETQQRTPGGYSIVSWSDDGMSYCAVSDVNLADLKQLTAAMRSSISSMQSGTGK